ncbi:MAG: serine hydrolase, partial [Candidatus Uhrbacteria bacterium]
FIIFGNTPNVLAFDQDAVAAIQAVRPDLQVAFDVNGVAIPGTAAGWLIDIYDWAEQYGWREHQELAGYAPTNEYLPDRIWPTLLPEVTANSYVIVDKNSGQILAANNADQVWPIASLTKLVTADVVLDNNVNLANTWSILDDDDVGGAKLWVDDGATMSINDLLYSTLVASANNAANALSRTVGLSGDGFLWQMNRRPFEQGLAYTEFVDPTGIELGNVSTAREMARLANSIFAEHEEVRNYTSTPTCYVDILSNGVQKRLTNTNWMLYDSEYDDVYVTAGKTGYLIEAQWNLVVQLRPSAEETEKELLLVLFGSGSRSESFNDAKLLADWAWENHYWSINPSWH